MLQRSGYQFLGIKSRSFLQHEVDGTCQLCGQDGISFELSALGDESIRIRGEQRMIAFTDHGGILKDRCSIIRIETDPAVAVDLESEGCSSTLRGKKLIISAQCEKLDILFSRRKVIPVPSRCFPSVRPASYPFCLHMGVHEEGLPESIAPYVLVLRDQKGHVTNRDHVFLQMSLPGDIDRAPVGRRALSAMVYLKDSPLRLSDQELKNKATGIIDSLEEFLPFLRESIDYLCVDQSISCSRRYQEMVNRKYRIRRTPFFGMKTLSPQTRIPNVFLTGGVLRPDLGFEGEIIAGIDAAFRAQKGSRPNAQKTGA